MLKTILLTWLLLFGLVAPVDSAVYFKQHETGWQVVLQDALQEPGLDKLLASVGGWGPISEKVLWPYEGATFEEVQKIKTIAKQELPELFNV